jgi:hypothetical protein
VEAPTREDYHRHPGRVRTTRHLKTNRKRPHLPPSRFRFRIASVSTRVEAPSLSLSLPPQRLLLLFLLERRHAMMGNSTLNFRIDRLRTNARDHGSGRVEPKRSPYEGGTPSFCREDITCNSCSPDPTDLRADSTNHVPVRDEISFPAQSFVSRLKYRLAPAPRIWIPPFCICLVFFWWCRGDAVAMVNNSTPKFGMAAKFSRPKSRKSDHGRECLKAVREL